MRAFVVRRVFRRVARSFVVRRVFRRVARSFVVRRVFRRVVQSFVVRRVFRRVVRFFVVRRVFRRVARSLFTRETAIEPGDPSRFGDKPMKSAVRGGGRRDHDHLGSWRSVRPSDHAQTMQEYSPSQHWLRRTS